MKIFQNNCVTIKSFKVDITITTNSFDKFDQKNKHCHITIMDIKTINNAGQDSNVPMTCMLIGDVSNSKRKAVMTTLYFTGSTPVTIVNTVVVLVVQAHGIQCTIVK